MKEFVWHLNNFVCLNLTEEDQAIIDRDDNEFYVYLSDDAWFDAWMTQDRNDYWVMRARGEYNAAGS